MIRVATLSESCRAPALLVIIWVPFLIATTTIVARYYVRRALKNLGLDDYLMFIAWALYTSCGIVETVYIAKGGVMNESSIHDLKQRNTISKLNYIANPYGVSSITLSKCSVGFVFLRLLNKVSAWRKWFIYTILGVYLAAGIELSGVLLGQCVPASKSWEVPRDPRAHCLDARVLNYSSYFHSSYGAFVDVALALFPISMVKGMKMEFRNKLTICILMGLGLFAAVCTAFKTVELASFDDNGNGNEGLNFNVVAWTFAEIAIVLICGTIPVLKPLYDQLFLGKPMKDRLVNGSWGYPNQRNSMRRTNSDIRIEPAARASRMESRNLDHIPVGSKGLIGPLTFELDDL